MPATYAHYRFGRDCMEALPSKVQQICFKHEDLFNLGVHGPDILFYFHPLHKNSVSTFGSEMHEWSGKQFFETTVSPYNMNMSKESMLAYLLGFLAHFTLDSATHAYINRMDQESEFSHNYIESQYEAFLMRKDEMKPMKVNRSELLKPSKKNAQIISRFFDYQEETILKALEGQQRVLKLLYSPLRVKKVVLKTLIRILPINKSFADLFLDSEENPKCEEMTKQIYAYQKDALSIYPSLARNLISCLYGKEALDDRFGYNFEGIAGDSEIETEE